jgi:hypothetical protein
MLNATTRRVGALRIRAADESSARRGTILLEDALHTASLPVPEDGRLWILRRLEVGRFSSQLSAASVALLVERRLLLIPTWSVHAADAAAAQAPVVFFHDAAEPYLLLARRLIRGQSVGEWFWNRAVPEWGILRGARGGRGEAAGSLWRDLLCGVTRHPGGVMAAIGFLDELESAGKGGDWCAWFSVHDGQALLEACGWSSTHRMDRPSVDAEPGRAGICIRTRWPAGWAYALEKWEEADPRAVWWAALSLVAEKPSRLSDSRLMQRAQDLFRLLAAERGTAAASPSSGEVRFRASTSGRTTTEAETARFGSATVSSEETACTVNPGMAPQTHSPPFANLERKSGNDRKTPLPSSEGAQSEQERPESDAVRKVQPKEESGSAPLETSLAGLFFLVPVLNRLGLPEFLDHHPEWIERDFPLEWFRFVGRHLGAEETDPVLKWMDPESREAAGWPDTFILPSSWRRGLCREGPARVRRVMGRRGVRLVCDATGRLTLAQWKGRWPEELAAWVQSRGVRRGKPVPELAQGSILCQAWMNGARRWCRRQAGLGLSQLIRRPGRIALTPTHLDLYFDHRQASVPVRRAGLDLNPGWVPWLGRVVQFHYLYGQPDHGSRSNP